MTSLQTHERETQSLVYFLANVRPLQEREGRRGRGEERERGGEGEGEGRRERGEEREKDL